MRKILLVNDDGYSSDALLALEKELAPYGEVYVVAPKGARSGSGMALTIVNHVEIEKRHEHLYIVDATPADCVSFALTSLPIKFDLTVSGINYGHNLTYDVMHSGTCGACAESLFYGVPAIAFSGEKNVVPSAKLVSQALDYIFNHDLLSLDYFLNVNFPIDVDNAKGIKFTKLDFRNDSRWFEYDEKSNIATPKRIIGNKCGIGDGDVETVKDGYISITPLMKSFFSIDLYERIKKDKNL